MKLGRGIYLRGDIYWYSFQKDGKRQYVTLQTTDPAVALSRAAEMKANFVASAPDPTALKTEVAKFIADRAASGKWSRQTTRVHGAALREFVEEVGEGTRLSQITPVTARMYYVGLQGRLKESGAQIRMRALKTFFAHLAKSRRILASPFETLELRDIPQLARTSFCTRAQRDLLLANAPTDDLRFILYCGFHCGMRRGEIVEARAGWFDIRPGGNVHIQNTSTFRLKDSDNRFVPLTAEFRAFLGSFLEGRGQEDFPLRPQVKHGRGTYRYDFIRPYSDYVEKQGLPWAGPHVMRKTFASLLVQAGVSIYKVAAWLGDGVEVAQKHYAHLAPQDAEIEKLM